MLTLDPLVSSSLLIDTAAESTAQGLDRLDDAGRQALLRLLVERVLVGRSVVEVHGTVRIDAELPLDTYGKSVKRHSPANDKTRARSREKVSDSTPLPYTVLRTVSVAPH